jgi:ABC-2 type transport system ATP-binding protein
MNGRPLSQRDRASQIFYLPDGIAPWPAQTVGWALDFAAGFFGRSGAANGTLRDEVVARLDLGPLLESPMGTLSKGQRKRAVLAVGMLTPHPVLLADEPFDGLDLRQTREVGAALRAHAAAGRTLFLSIHQITDAARVCDRFVLLSGGRVRGEGTVRELAERVTSNPSNLEDIFLALT